MNNDEDRLYPELFFSLNIWKGSSSFTEPYPCSAPPKSSCSCYTRGFWRVFCMYGFFLTSYKIIEFSQIYFIFFNGHTTQLVVDTIDSQLYSMWYCAWVLTFLYSPFSPKPNFRWPCLNLGVFDRPAPVDFMIANTKLYAFYNRNINLVVRKGVTTKNVSSHNVYGLLLENSVMGVKCSAPRDDDQHHQLSEQPLGKYCRNIDFVRITVTN